MESVNPLLRMNGDAFCRCGNPFCTVQFEASGPAVRPKRFCSPECTRIGWALRKMSALLKPLGKDRAWDVLTDAV